MNSRPLMKMSFEGCTSRCKFHFYQGMNFGTIAVPLRKVASNLHAGLLTYLFMTPKLWRSAVRAALENQVVVRRSLWRQWKEGHLRGEGVAIPGGALEWRWSPQRIPHIPL